MQEKGILNEKMLDKPRIQVPLFDQGGLEEYEDHEKEISQEIGVSSR